MYTWLSSLAVSPKNMRQLQREFSMMHQVNKPCLLCFHGNPCCPVSHANCLFDLELYYDEKETQINEMESFENKFTTTYYDASREGPT